jgi:hypothetical protein
MELKRRYCSKIYNLVWSRILCEAEAACGKGVSVADLSTQIDDSQQVVDLSNEEKIALATASLESLPQEQKQNVATNLGVLPDQLPNPNDATVNWIWRLTIGVFVFVLVASVLTLCAATLWYPNADTQIILTVVTTVVGTLAGFISGRASGAT